MAKLTAIYLRASTDYQTVEQQKEQILDRIRWMKKLADDETPNVIYFQDEGVSAKQQKSLRQRSKKAADGGAALMKAIDDGIIEDLFVIDFDRLWRHGLTGITEAIYILEKDVKIYAASGNTILDLTTSDGFVAFWNTLGSAQFESMRLSERVTRKMDLMSKQGKAVSGMVYGWDINDDGFVIPNLEEQAVIQWIRNEQMKKRGRSAAGMASYLNDLGVPTKTASLDPSDKKYNPNSKWNSGSVLRSQKSKTQLNNAYQIFERYVTHPYLGRIRIGYEHGMWETRELIQDLLSRPDIELAKSLRARSK